MKTYITITGSLIILLLSGFAFAMNDPSQVYCESLGYQFKVEPSDGGFAGVCLIEGQKIDSWKFLRGEAEIEKNACTKKGYKPVMVEDPIRCWYSADNKCIACVLANGKNVEVTKMLNLNFLESSCGDGICGMPENHKSCASDCPAGGGDNLCEDVADGVCDIDCRDDQDPDCNLDNTKTTLPLTKPLNQKEDTSCIPGLLGLATIIFSAAATLVEKMIR